MNIERQTKVLSIVALVVAIVGMSLGFAAFSSSLNISSSATVSPNSEDFKFVISGSATDPYQETLSYTSNGVSSANVTTDGKRILISDVGFSEPGASISVGWYTHNIGKYTGYLRKVKFNNVTGSNSQIVCSPVDDKTTSVDLVSKACEGIKFSLTVENGDGVRHDLLYYYGEYSISAIDPILPGQVRFSYVTINYSDGSAQADGPFTIQFGDIESEITSAN